MQKSISPETKSYVGTLNSSKPLLGVRGDKSFYPQLGKRLFDLLVVAFALIVLSPLFAAIAFLIRMSSPGPVLHRTTRLARGGGSYTLLKFRTMAPDAERRLRDLLEQDPVLREEYYRTYKLRKDPRITPIGSFLRRWSLDELPQLINVLKGDMSLIGPRQILPSEIWKYGANGRRLITVRPGITGLWQVSGRSRLSYEDRVRLDMEYIDHLSFWTDLKIIAKTPLAVIQGDGAI